MAFFDFSGQPVSELSALNQDRELLPAGTYAATVVKIESRTPKNGGPDYLNIEFKIEAETSFDGCPYVGRRVWRGLFLNHGNEKARSISQQVAAELLAAVGQPPRFDDRDLENMLKGKPIYIVVTHEVDQLKGGFREAARYFFGRAELVGKHRYSADTFPTPDTTITGNLEVCTKATAIRDRKIASQPVAPQPPAYSNTTNNQRFTAAQSGFDDVPF
jgi:hypothetical protein